MVLAAIGLTLSLVLSLHQQLVHRKSEYMAESFTQIRAVFWAETKEDNTNC